MSKESRIKERAHRLWRQEGEPEGRHLDHWVQAEREEEAETAPAASTQANEGEGNRTAARAYNRKAKDFAEKGPVKRQARKARADLESDIGKELREAELVGRSHSHGEDPTVKRS